MFFSFHFVFIPSFGHSFLSTKIYEPQESKQASTGSRLCAQPICPLPFQPLQPFLLFPQPSQAKPSPLSLIDFSIQKSLDQLLERAVDGRAGLDALVEIHGRLGALADALGGELEFLN